MIIQKLIEESFCSCFSRAIDRIEQLPRSGSDRRYFRIYYDDTTVMAAYNPVVEENEAFVGFSKHFVSKDLPVPRLFFYLPEKCLYFLEDLGETNLYSWLQKKEVERGFDTETKRLYEKILDKLVLFQVEGVKGLDLSLCYPHKAFDRQSMMWDMNYFKYMYLKLLAIPFNEGRLEKDFDTLAKLLLEAGQECFLYRDFQTANIMIKDDEPWFIDYQGGRLGAPQYDAASLLYDAKIQMNNTDRQLLVDYYAGRFSEYTGIDTSLFMAYYSGFSLIRVMQACGAFGFRGLYEKKPTFTESVVPGGFLLQGIIKEVNRYVPVPELSATIHKIPESDVFKTLQR